MGLGNGAFGYCSSLTSITIPDRITEIEGFTFNGCRSLTSIMIPNSVTSIGERAFQHCISLTSVIIPDNVTLIGEAAFIGCSGLTSITAAEGNLIYRSENNCLIETKSKTLILGCSTSVIPDGVTSIGDHAFSGCDNLLSVVIPDSVTSIGDHAFFACSNLANITIPNRLPSIGIFTFSSCSSLKEVYYTGTEEEWEMMKTDYWLRSLPTRRYYYSETEPTEEGNYWHYVDGVPTPWKEYVIVVPPPPPPIWFKETM